ncbi:MAG: sigma-70 family RNA polymerase sigma factor [Lachnospiraceae bacterium]|nr:sigma-70 family RNA polymerase sigma factor [Lachnospiraceae bacterium]
MAQRQTMQQREKEYLLEEIFEQYRAVLYRIAFTHMKDHADAEDMVQEVFIRMMRNCPILKTEEHRKAWMIRTLLNLCKDHEKQAWNRKRIPLTEIPETEKAYFHIPVVGEDETLWRVLSLPEKYRDPLYLFYYEDYSIREISEILGEQENTVKTHLRRGREELRQKITAGQ